MSFGGPQNQYTRNTYSSTGAYNILKEDKGGDYNRPSTLRNFSSMRLQREVDGSLKLAQETLRDKEAMQSLTLDNNTLKMANDKLQLSINELNKKVLDMRTRPSLVRISSNPDTDLRVQQLDAEVQRLSALLETKEQLNADLRLKVKRTTTPQDTEKLTRMLREELRVELEEKNLPVVSSLQERILRLE